MTLKKAALITVFSCMTLPSFAHSVCTQSNRVFFCQTKENTQVNLCKQGNHYHYEYGYIGYKPKQKLKIPRNKIKFEYYVIEGTRNFYSAEFAHNSVIYSISANYPRNKADSPAFANVIQSTNQGNNIIEAASCRMDALTDNIKKYQ